MKGKWIFFSRFSLTNRAKWRHDTSTTRSESQSMNITQQNFYIWMCFCCFALVCWQRFLTITGGLLWVENLVQIKNTSFCCHNLSLSLLNHRDRKGQVILVLIESSSDFIGIFPIITFHSSCQYTSVPGASKQRGHLKQKQLTFLLTILSS